MTIIGATSLSDSALLSEIVQAASVERRSTADLVALLAEFDRRKLYLCRGYASLFAFCTRALHLSEPAAYMRITAARAARQFPVILKLLAGGDVTLTAVTLLAAHLTADNQEALLAAARHKSKRDVERLVAIINPHPIVASSVRRLPAMATLPRTAAMSNVAHATPAAGQVGPAGIQTGQAAIQVGPAETQVASAALDSDAPPRPPRSLGAEPVRPVSRMPTPRHAVVAPIAADRYLLKVTLSTESHAKLEQIRDLLRHAIPNGDPEEIVDRALTALLEKLQKSKYAATSRPRSTSRNNRRSRHVPSPVKRAVWARDQGRCAFIGTDGRCAETGFLEFHHIVPFAVGGPATVENLELRCRAHNGYEADEFFGAAKVARRRSRRPARPPTPRTLSGQSSGPHSSG